LNGKLKHRKDLLFLLFPLDFSSYSNYITIVSAIKAGIADTMRVYSLALIKLDRICFSSILFEPDQICFWGNAPQYFLENSFPADQ